MRILESKFNPLCVSFYTKEEWSKILKPPISFWIDEKILKVVVPSILEEEELLLNLGKGEKTYQFQKTDSGILAFPKDQIGKPISITDQIYQFCTDNFLKLLARKNGFNFSGQQLPEGDYIIGDQSIGNKKIIWICSFNTEGFQKYKTKPYFEQLNKEYAFILLSDCVNSSPYIKDSEQVDYIPLPFELQNFEIDFHKFIKKDSGIDSDEARNYLKDKITFFIDNKLGKIYYKNKLCKIKKGKGDGSYTYKFFIALLQKPSEEYEIESFVEKEVGLSAQHPGQDLAVRGRRFKKNIKDALKKIAPNDDIDKLLPDATQKNRGNIKLHLLKKDIFFF